MTNINQIHIKHFRNFQNLDIKFNKNLNIFYGDNGSGKTNILEAISLISKGRGFRNSKISELINNSKKSFFIESTISNENINYDISVSSLKNEDKQKKIISINDDNSKEALEHLHSFISFLIFLPEMERLFQSSPSYRRNFIDRLIFSEKNDYNKLINKYKKNILERNRILQQNNIDKNWIDIIETEIANIGLQIYELRNLQLNKLNKHILKLNEKNNYDFDIDFKIKDDFYDSNFDQNYYIQNLNGSRDFDKKFGGSKIGPHKSDITATINSNFEASQLSTGQQKTVVLMMLLAQCDYLINSKKIKPILLLDEICSHLDSNNRKILLDLVSKFDIQLFLTGTEKNLFSFISTNAEFYNITKL